MVGNGRFSISPFTIAGVMWGRACSSLSDAALGSTRPVCAPADGIASTSKPKNTIPNATTRAIAPIACCMVVMGIMGSAPSIAFIRKHIGETQEPQLHHHARRQQRRRLGAHHLLQQL